MGKILDATDNAMKDVFAGRAGRSAADDEGAAATPNVPKTDRFAEARRVAADASEGQMSPHGASVRSKLRYKRQLNFGQVPAFVVDEFDRLAEARGMGKREFFYHLLRKEGGDIPSYDQLDARKF